MSKQGALRMLPFLVAMAAGDTLAQWQADVRLTNHPASSTTSFNAGRSMAASGTVLHVTWSDDRDGNREIYYKRSIDEGEHWSGDVRLTANAATSIFPALAAEGTDVHVVWEEYRNGNAEIYYKHSADGGSSWGPDTRLTFNAAHSFSPSVSVADSAVHLVWFDQRDGNNEIYYKRSTDAGAGWGSDTRLTMDSASSIYPAMTVSGPVLHVAWEEHRHGNGEIYYKRSADGGSTWAPDERLTVSNGHSFSPAVSASGALVHVVWHDERDGNQEIYDKRSLDAGLAWGADTRLTSHPGASSFASVEVSGSRVHVVWFDERDGHAEIYHKRSVVGGPGWTGVGRLTVEGARSTDPVVDTSGSFVHVLWTDARDNSPVYTGNYEIYYKRDPTGNAVGTPGSTPDGDGVPGTPLLIGKEEPAGAILILTWGPACSASVTDYAVYEGSLGDFTSHAPVSCTTAAQTTLAVSSAAGSRYYLVVPHDGTNEGSYGRDGSGADRPQSLAACLMQLLGACP